MAPPSLRSWLRTFLRHEIDKTLDWKRNGDGNATTQQNQAENGGQVFSDDGSNLRSYVSRLEDGKDLVQIIEVLSIQPDFAEVRISDGQTKVRARLAKDIVSQWEHDAGEDFSQETKGDVVQLKELIVVSTSFGPSEGFVWLDVLAIEYCYHLRKLCGQPVAVDQDRHLKLLIDDIADLRKEELAIGEVSGHDESSQASSSISQGLLSNNPHHENPTVKLEAPDPPVTPRSLQTELAKSPMAATQNQVDILSTERPSSERRKLTPKQRHPRLERDGFEVQEGVNLAVPVAPRIEFDTPQSLTVKPSIIRMTRPEALLGLMNKKRSHDGVTKDPEQQITNTDRISETPLRPNKVRLDRDLLHSTTPKTTSQSLSDSVSGGRNVPNPSKNLVTVTRTATSSYDSASNIIETQQQHVIISSASSPSFDDTSKAPNALSTHAEVPMSQSTHPRYQSPDLPVPNQVQSEQTVEERKEQIPIPSPSSRKRATCSFENGLAYSRRGIAPNQRKLLDNPSSWFPSLPGQRFPIPNVPIEMLSKWGEMRRSAADLQPARSRSHVSGSSPRRQPIVSKEPTPLVAEAEDKVLPKTSDEMSDNASESDEDVPFSDWSYSSPPQARQQVPPPFSSPPKGIERSTQGSDIEISAPRPLPVRTSPKKPVPQDNIPAPSPEGLVPQSSAPTSSPKRPIPQSNVPTPSPDRPIAQTNVPIPGPRRPISQSNLPTPSSKRPVYQGNALTPSPKTPVPQSVVPSSSPKRPVPRSDVLTPSPRMQGAPVESSKLSEEPTSSRKPRTGPSPSAKSQRELGSSPKPQTVPSKISNVQQEPASSPGLRREPSTTARKISPPRHPSDMNMERRRKHFKKEREESRETLGRPVMAPRETIRRTGPPTPFEEFYDNFTTLRPGGVWARPRPTVERDAVDVLAWEF